MISADSGAGIPERIFEQNGEGSGWDGGIGVCLGWSPAPYSFLPCVPIQVAQVLQTIQVRFSVEPSMGWWEERHLSRPAAGALMGSADTGPQGGEPQLCLEEFPSEQVPDNGDFPCLQEVSMMVSVLGDLCTCLNLGEPQFKWREIQILNPEPPSLTLRGNPALAPLTLTALSLQDLWVCRQESD